MAPLTPPTPPLAPTLVAACLPPATASCLVPRQVKTDSGYKTRSFGEIRAELRAFFDVHESLGTHAGGFHIEMTGDDVTECLGGLADITEEDLQKRCVPGGPVPSPQRGSLTTHGPLLCDGKRRYTTHCDPRLNGAQSIELAFLVAQRMRLKMGLPPLVDGAEAA